MASQRSARPEEPPRRGPRSLAVSIQSDHTAGMDATKRLSDLAESWIADDPDKVTQAELRSLLAAAVSGVSADSRLELESRFRGRLGFGTAGLRGVLAAGPMRMNRAVVAKTTWAV